MTYYKTSNDIIFYGRNNCIYNRYENRSGDFIEHCNYNINTYKNRLREFGFRIYKVRNIYL